MTPGEGGDQYQQRLVKLARLREKGIEPYPHRFDRTHTACEALDLYARHDAARVDEAPRPSVACAGRLMAIRRMGKATFAHVTDGSGRIQVYLRQDVLGEDRYALVRDLDLGDFVGLTGDLFRTRSGEVTIEAKTMAILSKALRPLPEKWHGLTDTETRFRQRYLDLISNDNVRRVFEVRGAVLSAMRSFLEERCFLEVETPVLQPIYGGAAARPFLTHYNALDHDFYLRIASELYLKRLLVGGIERVYEIGKNFRNEGVSFKHNPEFTVMELYEAYADYHDMMALVEAMTAFIAQRVMGTLQIEYQGETIDLTPPWRRVTLRDAILGESGVDIYRYTDAESLAEEMRRLGISPKPGAAWGKLIDPQLLSDFVEPKLIQPTFVIDYPLDISPLAKRKPGNGNLVERFEGFVGKMEVANAFTELNDPVDQRERLTQQSRQRAAGDEEAQTMDEDFVLALEHGMPPAGGLGMGIDRLIMLFTNQSSIREVILFPQLRKLD